MFFLFLFSGIWNALAPGGLVPPIMCTFSFVMGVGSSWTREVEQPFKLTTLFASIVLMQRNACSILFLFYVFSPMYFFSTFCLFASR